MTDSFIHPFRAASSGTPGADGAALGDGSELLAIRHHAEQLAQGLGALVMWFGPRGSGKSRLLYHASSVVTEVVPHVRTIHVPGDTLRDSTIAGVSAMLVHALDLPPSSDTDLMDSVLANHEERRITDTELMRAAANIGRQATATRPLLVLIDDLPYFASEDISALAILAARIAELPLLIICTSTFPLSEDSSLSAFGPLWMRRINPVSPAGAWNIAKTYSAGFIPPSVGAQIGTMGGGLPGDIVEIVRGLTPAELHGVVAMPSIVSLSTPALVEARQWLTHLPDSSRQLVIAAALDPFGNRDDIEAGMGAAMESAGHTRDDRWFTADGAHYTFASARRRAAVLAVAARRDVLSAHRTMAEYAAEGSAQESWHRLRAGDILEDADLAQLADEAYAQMDTGDLELAFTLAREGLTVAQEPNLRSRLSLSAGLAALHLGYVETAYEELSAVAAGTKDDALLSTAVAGLVLTVMARDGSLPTAVLDSTIARLRDSSPTHALRLASLAARVGTRIAFTSAGSTSIADVWGADHHQFPAVHQYLDQARELAQRVSDDDALSELQFSLDFLQDPNTADVRLLTVPLSRDYLRSDLVHWSRLLTKVEFLSVRCEMDAALLAIADTRANLMRVSSPLFSSRLIVAEIRMHLALGNVQRAVSLARDTLYDLPLHLIGPGLGVYVVAQAFTLAGLNDLADPWTSATRLAAHHFTTPYLRAHIPALLGLRASMAGDLQAAAEFFSSAARHCRELGAPAWSEVFLQEMEHHFLIGADLSDSPTPGHISDALEKLHDPAPEQLLILECALCLSVPSAELLEHVQQARSLTRAVASPLARAQALLLLARVLHRLTPEEHSTQVAMLDGALVPPGKPEHISLLLSAATSAAEEAGANALLPVISRVRPGHSSGSAPRHARISPTAAVPSPVGTGETLTPEERTVALMVAAGASNKQVAAAMFVSVRTVELRLTTIYRKLDISSRKELPRAMSSLDAVNRSPKN